jgi:hypothetical protein
VGDSRAARGSRECRVCYTPANRSMKVKYILIMIALFSSCAAGPQYRDLKNDRGREIIHPDIGKLTIEDYTNHENWPPDTLRIKPIIRVVFGEDPSIKLVKVEYWPFSHPCGLPFIVLQPDTIKIDFGESSANSRIDLYKGLIIPGYYEITLVLWDHVPDRLNVLGLSVGEEIRYFQRHNSCYFTETTLQE